MRIRRTAVLAATLAAFVPWTPAHAAAPTVEVKYTISYNQMVGGGWLAVVGCRALAQPAAQTQVPVVTQVTCSVRDSAGTTTSRSVLAAGPLATTEISVLAPMGQVQACKSGEGVFMDEETNHNQLYFVTTPEECLILPNT